MSGQKKINEKGYVDFVKTWSVVRLKELSEISYEPATYRSVLYEEFDSYDHEISRIEEASTICTCRNHKNHAPDCGINPHMWIFIPDSKGKEFGVQSIFLKPVKINQEVLDLPEKPVAGEPICESEVKPAELVQEKTEPEIQVEEAGTKYTLVVLRDKNLEIFDAIKYEDNNFIFNPKSEEFVYCDIAGKFGQEVLVGKDGFVFVIEGNRDHVENMLESFYTFGRKASEIKVSRK